MLLNIVISAWIIGSITLLIVKGTEKQSPLILTCNHSYMAIFLQRGELRFLNLADYQR